MRTVRLAYRDRDRLPFIECVREMARRHYGVEVAVQRIDTTEGYEDALFDDGCDVIIEHLEYLYARAAEGAEVTMFCAPVSGSGVQLVVPPAVASVSELSGATIAVRTSGRPESVFMRLRALRLDPEPNTVLVADAEVGRWGQWKKVVSGECAATFMSPIYLPQAEAAGLKVLPVPDIPMVGNFGQACLSAFASEDDGPMEDYMRAVVQGWRNGPGYAEVADARGVIDDARELLRQGGGLVDAAVSRAGAKLVQLGARPRMRRKCRAR